jgi:hypothetical protein
MAKKKTAPKQMRPNAWSNQIKVWLMLLDGGTEPGKNLAKENLLNLAKELDRKKFKAW